MTKDQINELIRQHGDRLRGLSHGAYSELARAACGDSPAVSASIRAAKIDPERRFSNMIRSAVLRHLASAGSNPAGSNPIDRVDVGSGSVPATGPTRGNAVGSLGSTLAKPTKPDESGYYERGGAREPGDESERGIDLHGLDLV